MKIFVSWSGEQSKKAAEALRIFLKDILQALDPWVSSQDIAAGAVWHRDLTEQLKSSDFAIVCLTRGNRAAPWLNFEAGAISNAMRLADVCPYLLDASSDDIAQGPLGAFQAVTADQDGTWRLLSALNAKLPDGKAGEIDLQRRFKVQWKAFEEELAAIFRPEVNTPANRIFVSAPITSLPVGQAYEVLRAEVMTAITHLADKLGKNAVYSALERIETPASAEPERIAFQKDMSALKKAEKLVLFYPAPVPSSALFEAGYAFAHGKPAVYFVRRGVRLPFVLDGAVQYATNKVQRLDYGDEAELLRIIDQHADQLFPTPSEDL